MLPFSSRNCFSNKKHSKLQPKVYESSPICVPDWLSARYLLRSLGSNIIDSCYDDIIQLFGNKINIISTLLRASTSEQIKNISKILKTAQQKEIEKNNYKIMSKYYENDDDEKRSYFDYLSEQSIFNICEFLQCNDMKQFKMTSTFISLIVFDIMRRYKIGVFNMNELIKQKQYKYALQLDLYGKLKINYIKSAAKNKLLMQIYSKRYHIDTQHLVILKSSECALQIHSSLMEQNMNIQRNIIQFREEMISNGSGGKAHFILDKTKIFTLNNTNKLKLMSQIDKAEEMKGYKIILLQYFDINQQTIQNVQFLWFDINTRLKRIEEYISNELLSTIDCSKEWCNKVLYTINKMKQKRTDYATINVYNHVIDGSGFQNTFHFDYNSKMDTNTTSDFGVITFEINQNHPYFADKIDHQHRLQPFYQNVKYYYNDQINKHNITMKCNDDIPTLCGKIKYFDTNNKIESNKFEIINLEISVTPLSTFDMVREQISLYFNNIIPIEQIQIYKYVQKHINSNGKWSYSSPKTSLFLSNITSEHGNFIKNDWRYTQRNLIKYKWEIVPYDTIRDTIYHIYQISIYELTESISDSPFTFPVPTAPKMLVRFNDGFEVEQKQNNDDVLLVQKEKKGYLNIDAFIKHMMDTMIHPMYTDKYESIINKYNRKDKYSFVIMTKRDITNKKYRCHDKNDIYVHDKTGERINFYNMNVLIVPIIDIIDDDDDDKKTDDAKFPIIVRFDKKGAFDIGGFGFGDIDLNESRKNIGFPLKMLITKQYTPQMIVDKVFDKENKFELYACSSCNGNIKNTQSIYDNLYGDDSIIQETRERPRELLIVGDIEKSNESQQSENTDVWSF